MALRKIKGIKKKRKPRSLKKPRTWNRDTVGSSKLETYFHAFLLSIGIEVETQYQIGYKFYDFKVKGKDILIEVDGDYYHANPAIPRTKPLNMMQRKAIINDRKKNALASSNGFTLIRVWENDFNKKKEEVKQRLLSII
jgi:very-short-patch-repair endonuclease